MTKGGPEGPPFVILCQFEPIRPWNSGLELQIGNLFRSGLSFRCLGVLEIGLDRALQLDG